jgi:acyl-coenzyme A thioesterase PaaI-like protein
MFDKKLLATNLKLNLFALFKIPLILFCSPRVIKLEEDLCEVVIPLNYRTKNHLGSMYFGALAIGADLAIAFIAMYEIDKAPEKISLVFKDMKGNFLKRATEDVVFRCVEMQRVRDLVEKAKNSEERVEDSIPISAFGKKSDERLADFELTLSLKKRS